MFVGQHPHQAAERSGRRAAGLPVTDRQSAGADQPQPRRLAEPPADHRAHRRGDRPDRLLGARQRLGAHRIQRGAADEDDDSPRRAGRVGGGIGERGEHRSLVVQVGGEHPAPRGGEPGGKLLCGLGGLGVGQHQPAARPDFGVPGLRHRDPRGPLGVEHLLGQRQRDGPAFDPAHVDAADLCGGISVDVEDVDPAEHAGAGVVEAGHLGATQCVRADVAEEPDRVEGHRQVGGVGTLGGQLGRQCRGQPLQGGVEHHRVDPVGRVGRCAVGQRDLGHRAAAGQPRDAGQTGEGRSVLLAAVAQRGVVVRRRHLLGPGALRQRRPRGRRVGRLDAGHGVAQPAPARRRVHLHARRPVGVGLELGDQACLIGEREHLLDLQLPHADRLDRAAQSLRGRGQDDLGERRAGQDRLAVHPVVGQPRVAGDTHVGLPQVRAVLRQFDVGAQQRVGAAGQPVTEVPGHPEPLMTPRRGRDVGEPSRRPALGRRRGDGGQLGVEEHALAGVPAQGRQHLGALGGADVLEGVVDRVQQHRMRTDLHDHPVVLSRGGDRLMEADRVAQVVRPVAGVEHRGGVVLAGGGQDRDRRRRRRQVGQQRAQLRQHRVDQRMVGGHVDLDRAGEQVLRAHRLDDGLHLILRPGDHRLPRRGVHREGESGVFGEQRGGGVGVEFEQRHRALAGQPRHQPRPGGDHLQTVRGAQRSGHHRGGDLSHRVPDHRVRRHTVVTPQRGQRQLHSDQDGLDAGDTGDRLACRQCLAQRKTSLRNEIRLQLVDRRGERRFVVEQPAAHPRPLRALTGVDEHRRAAAPALLRSDQTGRGLVTRQRTQSLHGLCPVLGGHRRQHRVAGAMPGQGAGDFGQWHLGAGALDPVGQDAGPVGKPLRGFPRHHQRAQRRDRSAGGIGGGGEIRALLQHHVRVGTAETERRHRRPTRAFAARPVGVRRRHEQTGVRCVDRRIPVHEVQVRRDVRVLQRQGGLDESGDPGGRLEVADVGLDRSQRARRGVPRGVPWVPAIGLGERVEFDRIAQSGCGAVGFHEGHRLCGHVGAAQRGGDHVPLRRRVRCGQAVGPAVLIHRRPADHRQHPVAVAYRVGQPFEHHHPGAFAADEAVRAGVEGAAPAPRGEHAPCGQRQLGLRAQDEADAAGQGEIALPHAQALRGLVDGDQRRRARGVERHRRSAQPQQVGDPADGDAVGVTGGPVRTDVVGVG